MRRPPYWLEGEHTGTEVVRREDFDLPQDAHWYLCPQTAYKFHPDFDRITRSDSWRPTPQAIICSSCVADVGPDGDRVAHRILPRLPWDLTRRGYKLSQRLAGRRCRKRAPTISRCGDRYLANWWHVEQLCCDPRWYPHRDAPARSSVRALASSDV